VKALSRIDRAIFKEDIGHAGLLGQIAPSVWQTTWNVHRQAHPDGHPSVQYLALSVCKVALANSRIVSLTGRPGTFTDRTRGSSRPRTTNLDAMELLRRFLPHVLPEGFMQVRHCGFLPASCAIPTDTLRRMSSQAHSRDCTPAPSVPPAPLAALYPTCGAPLRVVMRLWASHRAFVDTGCA